MHKFDLACLSGTEIVFRKPDSFNILISNYSSKTMKFYQPSILILFLLLISESVFSFSEFPHSDKRNFNEKKGKHTILLIDGKRSSHKELRKITPSKIREVNFITEAEKFSRIKKNTAGIIEVKLYEAIKAESEIPDTLQVRVNGMKITDFENQPTPLLVFDSLIIKDQNPNNIDTRQMEWIDFHLEDSFNRDYEEKAKTGIIEAKIIQPECFINLEIAPEFPGGEGILRDLIKNSIVYPEEALKDSLEGKVYVSFTITKTGKLENPHIARGIHPLLDKEAIRVVSSLSDWKPGAYYYLGKFGPVQSAFFYTVPVNFRLSNIQSKP